jgi:alcohol dehydrogenase class IV
MGSFSPNNRFKLTTCPTSPHRDIGVTEDKIPEMARLAFEANYNRWNPRYTTYEDFLALFERAY